MKKIAFTIFSLILTISLFSFTEFNGYPWKHAEIKKEAAVYMKDKYNMDAEVIRSAFNFKFDYYSARLFDMNDDSKREIVVEKQSYYDENGRYLGERLEDNYSQIYWKKNLKNNFELNFPEFWSIPEISSYDFDIAYFTLPIGEGVSGERGKNGVLMPLSPERCTLDMELSEENFSYEFLNEVLVFIKNIENQNFKIDLFITCKPGDRTNLLNLNHEKFKNMHSIEDLKKEISDF